MKLMLNDYNTELAGKRANVLRIVQDVMNAGTGADIDGVGHQFHLQLNADVTQVTAALVAVEGLGGNLVNHVTELDVSIYADPGTCFSQRTIPPCMADYGASPPQSVLSDQARTVSRAVQRLQPPERHVDHHLGRRRQSHLAESSFRWRAPTGRCCSTRRGDPKWAFWAVVDPNIAIP